MKQVMRWAGPRMLWRHPILTIRHLIDDRRPVPELPESIGPKITGSAPQWATNYAQGDVAGMTG